MALDGHRDRFLGEPVGTAEIWDPATLTFTEAGTLLAPRAGHVAAAQPDCTVLIIGADPGPDPSVERWVPGRSPG